MKAPAFSLIEIMVVLALLGVLVTLALPRYEVFLAKSRQAEARINLGVIHSLQESYHLKHDKYFGGYCGKEVTVKDNDGDPVLDADGNPEKEIVRCVKGEDELGDPGVTFRMTHAENAYGLTKSGVMRCYTNDLGFQVTGCSEGELRYGYFVGAGTVGDKTYYQAIAFGCSCTDEVRIFPGCDGAGVSRGAGNSYTRPAGLQAAQCTASVGRPEGNTAFATGDAWCSDENRRVENYRDIVEFCS